MVYTMDYKSARSKFGFVKDVTGRHKYIITGCKSPDSQLTIPSTIGNIAVTRINDHAFCDCSHIEEIVISEGVTSIGACAFCGCTNLKAVTIPDTVIEIDTGAFENCVNLEYITLPSGIFILQDKLFRNCKKLTRVSLPENIRRIGFCAFDGCEKLANLHIPAWFEITPTLRAFYGIHTATIISQFDVPEYNSALSTLQIGDTVEFGVYPQDTNGAIRPILWSVIDESNENKLLLSQYALDFFPKATKKYSSSLVRDMLNGFFFNIAFGEDERPFVNLSPTKTKQLSVTVSGKKELVEPDKETENLVFLLSIEEIERLLPDRKSRIAAYSDWAKFKIGTQSNKCSCWLLRDDIKYSRESIVVNEKGSCVFDPHYNNCSVRPAIWICPKAENHNFSDAIRASGNRVIERVVYILSETQLTHDDFDDTLTEIIAKNSPKIIEILLQAGDYHALDKVFSINNVITVRALQKLVDKLFPIVSADAIAYLLDKKNCI